MIGSENLRRIILCDQHSAFVTVLAKEALLARALRRVVSDYLSLTVAQRRRADRAVPSLTVLMDIACKEYSDFLGHGRQNESG